MRSDYDVDKDVQVLYIGIVLLEQPERMKFRWNNPERKSNSYS